MGFGILTAAFLVQPVVVALGWINGVPEMRVRLWTWVPFGIAGLTLLAVAQMRSRLALSAELARRQQAEASLQSLNESLEATVRDRTAQLEQIVEGLNAFTGMVSHDLSGPLRNAAGLTEVALDASDRGQSTETAGLLRRIRQEVLRGSSMVSDLMALARADQSPLERADVDIARLVQEAVRDLALQYPHAERAVRIDALPEVYADAAMMRHVVLNLLGNALKFTADYGSPSVTVSAAPDGDGWRIEIRDNGPGFDPAKASQLFKPFSRLGNAAVAGTGLGLTVVKRAVERHGGTVGAQAEPGSGALFWWTLPRAMTTAGGSGQPEKPPA
ncbi:sensor histidine kinase [Hydrogenophaga sp.]|uniref:sensor histidine kinase n=1 Tax=Hydrogenophaga sp. TaxID=1904254 RepID=UPI002FCBEC62